MPSEKYPQGTCRFGIALCDITPPVGIYHRMWGAATHDRATGIHRPLRATAMVFQPAETGDDKEEQILVAIDHVLLWTKEMDDLLNAVSTQASVPKERLVITFSHTHAAGLMGLERVDLPGGDLIPGYLKELASKIAAIVRQAKENIQAVNITYGTGRCSLARHRDFWDEETRQFVCGYNPGAPSDDTVMLARVNAITPPLSPPSEGGVEKPVALVVNYACHPTTLAWENTVISPDYPGAMRDLVEELTGVPCVFLQGASGDLGPREGYVGDVKVAERNGRQLGHAVMAAWEALPPAGTKFTYTGPVISGATLGGWAYEPLQKEEAAPLTSWQRIQRTVDLAYRPDLPTIEKTKEELQQWQEKEDRAKRTGDSQTARDCRAMVERMVRRLAKLETLPPGDTFPFPVLLWRIGNGIWVAVEAELYSWFQTTLRQRFPGVPIFVITLTNGSRPSYLPIAEVYGKGIYQESIAVLAPGTLEKLLEAVGEEIRRL